MLLVKVCRYAVVDADFYQGHNNAWELHVSVLYCRCTKTLHWDTKLFSFFIRLLKILFSSSLGEALAFRIWVKVSGFTLWGCGQEAALTSRKPLASSLSPDNGPSFQTASHYFYHNFGKYDQKLLSCNKHSNSICSRLDIFPPSVV